MKSLTLIPLAAFLLIAGQAQQQDTALRRGALFPQERQAAADAFNKNDAQGYRDALVKLYQSFPENSRVLRNLAAAEAKLGNIQAGVALLQQYAAMGCTIDLQNAGWAPIRDLARSVPQLSDNARPATHGKRLFRMPDSDLVVEDIGYDPRSKLFILSSVRQAKIVTCEENGRCQDFFRISRDIAPGGVLAIWVDARHEVLWATTAGMEAVAGFRAEDDGRSSVLKFDLRTHKLLRRYEHQDGKKHAMGDMTVAANGDAFVSDGLSGDVFTIRHDADILQPLAPEGVFLSPQTPALSPDEKFLYVPDYSEGIAIIRLSDRHIEWLKSSVPVAHEGIDGLYLVSDHLIAVQNGTQPERIVSFHLKSANEIDRFEVLEANSPGLDDPTHGTVVGKDFYFIANSGWDRVGEKGTFKPRDPAEVRRMPLK